MDNLCLPEYEATQQDLRLALCVSLGFSWKRHLLATLSRLLEEPSADPLAVEIAIEAAVEAQPALAYPGIFRQFLGDAYEALRLRPPETVRAVLDEHADALFQAEQCRAALLRMESRVRAIFEGLDDRTRCVVIALAKLADADLPVDYGEEIWNDLSNVHGEQLAQEMAQVRRDDPVIRDLLTVIRCADRVSGADCW